jgi:hypothetical protein
MDIPGKDGPPLCPPQSAAAAGPPSQMLRAETTRADSTPSLRPQAAACHRRPDPPVCWAGSFSPTPRSRALHGITAQPQGKKISC